MSDQNNEEQLDLDTISALLEKLGEAPVYVYFILFLLIMFLFGRKKEWEYEAKLFHEGSNNIIGEIEIKKYKKEMPEGELEYIELDKHYNKEIEILIDNETIQKIRINPEGTHYDILYPRIEKKSTAIHRPSYAQKLKRLNLYLDDRITPQNNQKIIIRANNEELASGQLIQD